MSSEGTARSRTIEEDGDESEAPLLEVESLKKHFSQAEGFLDRLVSENPPIRAVDGVDLTIREGETLAVVGESGCGKSTLGLSLLNLHEPTEGSIRFRGEELVGLSEAEMRPYRREMQMIFQDPLASLNPRQTVGQILTAPMEVHGIGDSEDERLERAEELVERVGLNPYHLDRYPHQFSGGQQQRVGIARALTMEPDLLVADEPVSALDVSVQAQILRILADLQEELDLAILFIAHDLSVVRHVADRVAVMYLGEIIEVAPVDELFENPGHPYTRSLLSAVPRIDTDLRGERVILEGTVPSPIKPPPGCRFHTRCPVVIPPEDWPGDRSAFVAAFAFRNRVLAGEVDVDAIETRLEAERDSTDNASVREQIVDGLLPGSLDDLPPAASDTVVEAADALVGGEDERAIELVRHAFPSPCEARVPRAITMSEGHVAACHRLDPNEPGEPTWPH